MRYARTDITTIVPMTSRRRPRYGGLREEDPIVSESPSGKKLSLPMAVIDFFSRFLDLLRVRTQGGANFFFFFPTFFDVYDLPGCRRAWATPRRGVVKVRRPESKVCDDATAIRHTRTHGHTHIHLHTHAHSPRTLTLTH